MSSTITIRSRCHLSHGTWVPEVGSPKHEREPRRINRRGILERGEYIHLTGSAKGEPKGEDMTEAMALALASAEAIRDKERPAQANVQLRIEDAE